MKALFAFLHNVTGIGLFYPLKNLSGGSFAIALSRLKRLQSLVHSMAHRSLTLKSFPVRVQIETVNACNFRCKMCARVTIGQISFAEISLERFTRLIKEIHPYYVTLNGLGEPFLDKTILKKIRFLVKNDIMVSMPTNGSLLNELVVSKSEEAFPDILQFSVDGATKKSFEAIRVGSNFETVIENYRNILTRHQNGKNRPGTQIRILCALQKKNFFEFQEMFALMSSLNALEIFCLVPIYNFSPETQSFTAEIPNPHDVEELTQLIAPRIKTAKTPREKEFYENWLQCAKNFEKPDQPSAPEETNTPCLIPWFNTYIAANGDVLPCCYLLGRPSHIMGNVLNKSFQEIWNGSNYVSFRKNLMQNRSSLPGCRTCPRNDASFHQKLKIIDQVLYLKSHLGIVSGKVSL
ncbi:MAG: radical SAM protein [Candidatus Riflebacteria bacterium]|nr:radical SAM protein [Candidatus Riflebacteria bacterium]